MKTFMLIGCLAILAVCSANARYLVPGETYKITCDPEYYQICFMVKLPAGDYQLYYGLAGATTTTESTLSNSADITAMWVETRPSGPNTGEGLVGGGGSPMLHSPTLKQALYKVTSSTTQVTTFSAWCSLTGYTP